MLLDYERYQRKSPNRKKKVVFFTIIVLVLFFGGYVIVTRLVLQRNPFAPLAQPAPKANLDTLWAELVRMREAAGPSSANAADQKKLLENILGQSADRLADDPLAPRTLVYNGYAAFYRALYEGEYEERLPYLDQAVISMRRAALTAGSAMLPQLYYMLGRTYFFKREYYYDLAAKYLEQALNLGYKKADVFEYLVLINTEWGNTEKTIEYLKRAYEEKQSDLYLFYLAKNYNKVKRGAEAAGILEKIIASSKDGDLLRECKFLMGEILFDQGKYAQAEKEYRDILKDDPDSAEAHYRLALIYEKSGDYAQYRYELRQTLEKDGGHSGARSRLR